MHQASWIFMACRLSLGSLVAWCLLLVACGLLLIFSFLWFIVPATICRKALIKFRVSPYKCHFLNFGQIFGHPLGLNFSIPNTRIWNLFNGLPPFKFLNISGRSKYPALVLYKYRISLIYSYLCLIVLTIQKTLYNLLYTRPAGCRGPPGTTATDLHVLFFFFSLVFTVSYIFNIRIPTSSAIFAFIVLIWSRTRSASCAHRWCIRPW